MGHNPLMTPVTHYLKDGHETLLRDYPPVSALPGN